MVAPTSERADDETKKNTSRQAHCHPAAAAHAPTAIAAIMPVVVSAWSFRAMPATTAAASAPAMALSTATAPAPALATAIEPVKAGVRGTTKPEGMGSLTLSGAPHHWQGWRSPL